MNADHYRYGGCCIAVMHGRFRKRGWLRSHAQPLQGRRAGPWAGSAPCRRVVRLAENLRDYTPSLGMRLSGVGAPDNESKFQCRAAAESDVIARVQRDG